jgi:hypothetical protein
LKKKYIEENLFMPLDYAPEVANLRKQFQEYLERLVIFVTEKNNSD